MPSVKTESDWEAEDNARILAHAEEIKSDPSKMKKATKAASKMAKEVAQRAQAMSKIASKSKGLAKKSTPAKSPKIRSKK